MRRGKTHQTRTPKRWAKTPLPKPGKTLKQIKESKKK